MKTILVTGSRGFIGRNLVESLSRRKDIKIVNFNSDDNVSTLDLLLEDADIVYHLAGVNRPLELEEFEAGNTILTQTIVSILSGKQKTPTIVMTSSIQAELQNPYGVSKKKAEDILIDYGKRTGAPIYIYRLPNVFGKWCRPNYNSVVATFCYNIYHGLDITISDRSRVLELVYIDDVVNSFLTILDNNEKHAISYMTINHTYKVSLGELADSILKFKNMGKWFGEQHVADDFMGCLYTTYLSYHDKK